MQSKGSADRVLKLRLTRFSRPTHEELCVRVGDTFSTCDRLVDTLCCRRERVRSGGEHVGKLLDLMPISTCAEQSDSPTCRGKCRKMVPGGASCTSQLQRYKYRGPIEIVR